MFAALLKRLAETLDQYQIDYIVIDGQALLLYGKPRLTKDIDITLGLDIHAIQLVREVIESLGLTPLVSDIEAFAGQTWVVPVMDGESGIRVDFILSFSAYERQAMERATLAPIKGYPVKFVSKEDLIIHKIIAGRPRDIEDVKSVLRKQSVNKAYIRPWLQEFARGLDEDFDQTFESIYKEVKDEQGR